MTSDIITAVMSVLLMIVFPPENGQLINMSRYWPWLVVLATALWAVPNILYCWVAKKISSLVKTMIAWSLDPALTILWVAIQLSEVPTTEGLKGGIIILFAVCLGHTDEAIKQRHPRTLKILELP